MRTRSHLKTNSPWRTGTFSFRKTPQDIIDYCQVRKRTKKKKKI